MDAREVSSRDDLVEFLEGLATDTRNNPESVENSSVPDLVDAASAWLADSEASFRSQQEKTPEYPSWPLLAMTFHAALYYE